jgi:hypothetical protein
MTCIKEIVNELLDDLVSKTIVKSYETRIKNVRCYTRKLLYLIENLDGDIKKFEKIIYKTCNHDWVRDCNDRYSRCKICTKCNLANLPYVYAEKY